MCCIVRFVPFEIKLHVTLFMSMIRKDMERVKLFQKVRIICAAATISTCKPQISQNCEIASIYQPEKPQWQNKAGGSRRRYLGKNSQITAAAV